MSDSKKFNVAVLGATGTVGEAMISILEERLFPVLKLYPLASHRSAGETVLFKKKSYLVEDVEQFDFSKVQIALFSAGSKISAIYAEKAAEAGCIVIDNTSYFRQMDDVPLVITEVNSEDIAEFRNRGIIANPNCSTMQMLVALKPLYDAVGITRINVATYQSVSGSGKAAINELVTQVSDLLSGRPIESVVYPKQIAFNVLPQIDDFLDNGYTREEMKMFWETQKIFKDPDIQVNATAVRVPVFYGHSMAIHLETARKISANDAKEILSEAPGVIVMDENQSGGYPTPIPEASGTDAVYVGRIREDISYPLGLNLWVVSDNIRKGAALNAVQIAEILVSDYL
ncbi:MAG TPA: aspartate-semialdehyde dehydrogenase [Gammaproteobacteria bacterium]|nr:aspartate-semialdehyde dehydrogenase [Gammaproteobacteria bacterium]HRA42063.1 aspartate-semialdehyde dehydrogenase [Gammaproteobacteria bacterium]